MTAQAPAPPPPGASPHSALPYSRVETPWLVLTFPDGSRGGRGTIQGTGSQPPFPGSGPDGFDPDSWGRLLSQLRECGAIEPHFVRGPSHRFVVVSRSTADDRKVVECFRHATSLHFTPSMRTNQPSKRGIDQNPFADLFTGRDSEP